MQAKTNKRSNRMSGAGRIVRVSPAAAIPGGEVVIECADYDTSRLAECRAMFEGVRGWLVGASPQRVLAIVPETNRVGEVEVVLESADEQRSAPSRMTTAAKLAEDLHLVANPAFDPEDGALYVTRSGSRGQRVPVPMFRIDTSGELVNIHADIVNPTGIAFDKSGRMFVTSRADGTVYRITPFGEAVVFARNLGVATGLAFDGTGRMYVGDRTGTIYRINGIGEAQEWASLEPSVAAYHLAFGTDDALYVSGPTVSSFDSITRIDASGTSEIFFRGLGRPQGMAFDTGGNLYVAASLRGRRGIVRISPDGRDAELAVAGMNVVGLAFSAAGDMVVATNEVVYTLPLGIRGTLV